MQSPKTETESPSVSPCPPGHADRRSLSTKLEKSLFPPVSQFLGDVMLHLPARWADASAAPLYAVWCFRMRGKCGRQTQGQSPGGADTGLSPALHRANATWGDPVTFPVPKLTRVQRGNYRSILIPLDSGAFLNVKLHKVPRKASAEDGVIKLSCCILPITTGHRALR